MVLMLRGSSRMIEISKREEFYQQEYCGCVYSLRDTNKWRQENNKDRIIRVDITLKHKSDIEIFEQTRRNQRPWLFDYTN